MAYNLESLVKLLHEILRTNHRPLLVIDSVEKPQIQSLLETSCFLKEYFQNSLSTTNDEVRNLESQIRVATYDAEDVIESHLARQLCRGAEGERFFIHPPDLARVIGKFDLIKKELMKIKDGTLEKAAFSPSLPISSQKDLNPKKIVVGMSDDLLQLKDRLTGLQPKRETFPIVGTGGIGKTTLARSLYNDPLIVSHFDVCAWSIISERYDVKKALSELLNCVTGKAADEQIEAEALGLELHQSLCGRRYLIVLDDIWSTKAWDDIQRFFPNDNNRSRIIVTTREQEVANYVDSEGLHHKMDFLNEINSWDLLQRKVFAEETCPPELEKIGKNIAKDCRGLPLAIHVIGGVLSQLERTQESWMQVAKDVGLAVTGKDEFSHILSLSYNHLPNHLKPCFLYLSAFPEDHIIQASKLIQLWVAEGFLKPIQDKSLEDAAEDYLKELIDRNLLLVDYKEVKGSVKSYIMHDLMRELCIRKAEEDKFLFVVTKAIQESCRKDMTSSRRLSAHTDYITPVIESAEFSIAARSFLYFGSQVIPPSLEQGESPFRELFGLELLRVLDILNVQFEVLPLEVKGIANLRYLAACSLYAYAPSWISDLHNLQTLILSQSRKCEPVVRDIQGLFNMPQVRHIKFKGEYPCYTLGDGESLAVQENLQTLSTIGIDNSFPRILEAIPNVMKLGILEGDFVHRISCTIDLRCLTKLKILKCSSSFVHSSSFLNQLKFPPSLKKLSIFKCPVPKGSLNEIGSLPYLEVLQLKDIHLSVTKWEATEGEFQNLRLLVIENANLVEWIADETSYPRLERLFIQNCSGLKEIPSGIGDIPTLEKTELHGLTTTSAFESARSIQQEQIEYENYALQVRITAFPLWY